MGLGDTLHAQVGPLPLWGWAAVGVGGFVVYRVIRTPNTTSQLGDTTATGVSSPITDTGVGGQTITQNLPITTDILSKINALVARVQTLKDDITRLTKRITYLKSLKSLTTAQQKELKTDQSLLAADKSKLATAQKELTAYESGLIGGSGGSGILYPLSTSNQINAPSLASDLTLRPQSLAQANSTPPTLTDTTK